MGIERHENSEGVSKKPQTTDPQLDTLLAISAKGYENLDVADKLAIKGLAKSIRENFDDSKLSTLIYAREEEADFYKNKVKGEALNDEDLKKLYPPREQVLSLVSTYQEIGLSRDDATKYVDSLLRNFALKGYVDQLRSEQKRALQDSI